MAFLELPGLAFHTGTGWLDFLTGEEASTIALGPVMFSRAEIDAWATGTEFTALAATAHGDTAWSPIDFGTSITTSGQRDDFLTETTRGKGTAALWAADGNAARLADVNAHLDGLKDIATFDVDVGADNLRMSWAVPNFLVAAWIVEYSDPDFETFLRDVVMPLLDWTTGGNWFATMAASRLMVASYLQDETLWNDAVAYLEYHVARTLYHSDFDGANVEPITGFSFWPAKLDDTTHNESATEQHWFNAVALTGGVYPATNGGTPFPDGTDAEVKRDLGHEVMAMTGWLQALLTMERVGASIPTHVADRVRANVEWLGIRVLYWIQNGTLHPTHPGTDGSPAGVSSEFNYEAGWYTAARYYAGDVPAVVDDLMAESDISGANVIGVCHQTVERFTEKTLL